MRPVPLRLLVDPSVSAEESVVLRYAPALEAWSGKGDGTPEEKSPVPFSGPGLTRSELAAVSQREGMRLLELPRYRGVQLFLLDETTRMTTGTYKSLDGCISTALSRQCGHRRVVFSSGSNAGIALTDYGTRAGLETYFFVPATTLYKLDGALFQRPGAHLLAVRGADRAVKEAARRFAQDIGAPLIPLLEWRMLSAACRGLFLAEQMRTRGLRFTWFSQSVCAAYGPIGIYRALAELATAGDVSADAVPQFLGVQQAGLSPLVQAWRARQATLPAPAGWSEQPIEPSLYNAHPDQTYPLLRDLLLRWGGDLVKLGTDEFAAWADEFVALLETVNIRLTRIRQNDETVLLERAGVMAGAATLKAIAEGRIRPGDAVLCGLTGGAAPAPSRAPQPEAWITPEKSSAVNPPMAG